MKKNAKEIMRETLAALGKIAVEAFDKGVNFEYDTREVKTDEPWITGNVSLEGWTGLDDEDKRTVYRPFQIYGWHASGGRVHEILYRIRKDIDEVSKFEILSEKKEVKVLTISKKQGDEN